MVKVLYLHDACLSQETIDSGMLDLFPVASRVDFGSSIHNVLWRCNVELKQVWVWVIILWS
jgi:hypothetical protein